MLADLISTIEKLRVEDLVGLSDTTLRSETEVLLRLVDQLSAQALRRVAEVDRRSAFQPNRFTSTTAWLIHAGGMAPGVAARKVRVACHLRDHPVVAESFEDGRVDEDRVTALAGLATAHPGRFDEAEEMLVGFAEKLPSYSFRKAVRYWRELADEEVFLRANEADHRSRWLRVSSSFSGMVRIEGRLDPESGAVVMEALSAATTPADRISGSEPRVPAQSRRADGLVEICRQWLDRGETVVGGERPHLSVIVDLDRLQGTGPGMCETERGEVLTAEAVRRIACDAAVSRVIVRGDSEPLDVGRRTRTIPPAIRRALVIRDGGCRFPGCDRPPAWCDAHHIRHWARGGETSLENLVLLCRRHHRMVHEGGYTFDTPVTDRRPAVAGAVGAGSGVFRGGPPDP